MEGRQALLVIAGLGWAAAPAGAFAESLEDALVQSYISNPNLEAARAQLRATDELVPGALAGWRPTASVTSGIEATKSDGSFGRSDNQGTSSQLDLEQPVYRGGATTANTRNAENLVRAQRAVLRSTEQQILLNAVTAYMNVLTDQAVVELSRNNRERLNRQLRAVRDRFDVGEVTRTDVAQAEAALSASISDLTTALGNQEVSLSTYIRTVGREPGRLTTPRPLRRLPPSEEEAQLLAERNNPEIIAAEYNFDASRADVDSAVAALRPQVSITGSLSYADDPGGGSGGGSSDGGLGDGLSGGLSGGGSSGGAGSSSTSLGYSSQASIGASVSVPLYQGGDEYALIRQNKQTAFQRRSEIDDALRAARAEVTSAWRALDTATSLISSGTEQVRANDIALNGIRQEALVGSRTVLDVLDTEQALFSSQVDLVTAARDQVIASYRLKAAIGELTAAQLGLPVEPYDDEAYYRRHRNNWFGLGPDIYDGR